MAELSAMRPAEGLLPRDIGAVRLAAIEPGAITAILPKAGRGDALDSALRAAHGVGWPAPGRAETTGGATCLWAGRDMALLIGPVPDPSLAEAAGLSAQSDGWVAVEIAGPRGPAVLARLVPVDLRVTAFPPGHAARTLCGHMTVSVWRTGEDALRILGFRSMAETLVHELARAAEAVAGRDRLI